MRELILRLIKEVAETIDATLVDNIDDETVLLESGLDSLGFAILVARLEEELERDPFTETDEIVYPRTLGEFVAIYES